MKNINQAISKGQNMEHFSDYGTGFKHSDFRNFQQYIIEKEYAYCMEAWIQWKIDTCNMTRTEAIDLANDPRCGYGTWLLIALHPQNYK